MTYTLRDHARTAITTRKITAEWIEATLKAPNLTIQDEQDPTTPHAFAIIPEHGHRVLRVIDNNTEQPPHLVTVYFDCNMKGAL